MRAKRYVGRLARIVAIAACAPAITASLAVQRSERPSPYSALTEVDLARLRDIGPVTADPQRHIFTLSPDQRRIAFQVREADPAANTYHLKMYVLDIRRGNVPILVDQGGEMIRDTISAVGGVLVHTGFPSTITPRWSPDGTGIYFLKRVQGATQIWKAATDGSGSAAVTHDAGEIEDFTLSSDGQRLIYSSRERDPAKQAQLKQESLAGYRYDSRFIPLFSSKPIAFPITRNVVRALDFRSGQLALATEADEARITGQASPTVDLEAVSHDGKRAWTSKPSNGKLGAPTELNATDDAGRIWKCGAPTCAGPETAWWTADGERVRFIRREGWARSSTAVYDWHPGQSAPALLYSTNDLLIDCQPLGEDFICLREQSTRPRHLVILNWRDKSERILYDPNPKFRRLSLGRVERLQWRNEFGVASFGDLVYPVGYQPGRAYPLVVVQYMTRGFLRGGTGDEFPIQSFANHGFAVLSVERPRSTTIVPDANSMVELEQGLLKDFKDRRNVLSTIEAGVQLLIARGLVVRDKIGITGLSDGSSTVQFAAINSRMFKVGSVSGCCWEPYQDALLGPAVAADFRSRGWPPIVRDAPSFWSRISLVRNAGTIAFPLLMQQSDDEYRAALASYTALEERGNPVALYVFPNEYHVKWQPAHRLSAYRRNVRWFEYWLQDKRKAAEWSFGDSPTGNESGAG